MKSIALPKPILINRQFYLIAMVTLFTIVTWFYFFLMPLGVDWHESFRAGTLLVLHGKPPYYPASGFVHPAWATIPLIPLALLPEKLGSALNSAITLFVFWYAAWKFGARKISLNRKGQTMPFMI